MWFAENFVMIGINLVGHYPAVAAQTPTHEWIVDIVIRLFRPLEKYDRRMKPRGFEILWPIGLSPRF